MRQRFPGVRGSAIAAWLVLAVAAHAETVSYTANLNTSGGNPVTDILILESDGMQVHASVYPSELPGNGPAVLSHDVPFAPTKSLVIGLTQGDENGSTKTHIVMFVDPAFAAANAGIQFSVAFAGARHSTTISNLQAAVAGDATQLAWFTDTFFPGPAAAAAFASHGPFTVAEFTSLTINGASVVAGNWVINTLQTFPAGDAHDALPNIATTAVNETATDRGPLDIAVTLSDTPGDVALDKTVVNNSGVAWQRFEIQLGTGSGSNFVPLPAGDMVFFNTGGQTETTGAFPTSFVSSGGHLVVFTGLLLPGGTAHFVVVVRTNNDGEQTITFRQSAIGNGTTAAAMGAGELALLSVLLAVGGLWAMRQRRRFGVRLGA